MSQLFCGSVRARRRSRCQMSCPCRCRGAMLQRVSTPGAPPVPGVNNRPVGRVWPVWLPVSAASCIRLTWVNPGRLGRSTTTSGTAPDRNTSSIVHKISSPRFGLTKSNWAGLIHALTPSLFSRSFAHDGATQITRSCALAVSHMAKLCRAGPQASCTRPSLRARASVSGSSDRAGPLWAGRRARSGWEVIMLRRYNVPFLFSTCFTSFSASTVDLEEE